MPLQLNLNQLYFFYVAAKYKGVRAAAQKLCVSPPAVSTQIKKLEQHLTFPLFIRKENGLKLTAEGEEFLPKIHEIFLHLEALEEELKRKTKNKQKEIYLGGHWLHLQFIAPKIIQYITATHPELHVKPFSFSHKNIFEKIRNKEIHLAIVENTSKEYEDLYIKTICESKIFFVVCSNNSLYNEKAIHIKDIKYKNILTPLPDSGFMEFFSHYFLDNNISFNKEIKPLSVPIIKSLLPNSHYGTFLPDYTIKKELSDSTLRAIDIIDVLPTLTVSLACLKKTTHEGTQRFLDSIDAITF